MSEPEGKITVVMPTGKKMDAILSLADAIAYNGQAAKALADAIGNLEAPKVHIENVHIETSSSPAIVVKSEETDQEEGVYLWSEDADFGYPRTAKMEPTKVQGIYKKK